jgi:glucose-1-phosphate adenylyltransferase
LLAEGCILGRAEIEDSIIGLRSQIADGVRIRRTILMGADYYDPPHEAPRGGMPLGIGRGCDIDGAIIDKNARIGPGVIIRPFPISTEMEQEQWSVRDGIVVIPKSTTIPAGTVITPEER